MHLLDLPYEIRRKIVDHLLSDCDEPEDRELYIGICTPEDWINPESQYDCW